MDLNNRSQDFAPFKLDWGTVLIYLALVFMGWLNIYAAVYDDSHSGIFDISQKYGMQAIWMGISFLVAITVLIIDDKYYHIFSYPLYLFSLLFLMGVFILGKEVNGARSWYEFGSIRIQPTEFMKVTMALTLAKLMSSYSFSMSNLKSVVVMVTVLFIPFAVVILQNDTGSALVYAAFAFMLFREGFSGWLYLMIMLLIALFLASFWIEPTPLLLMLMALCLIGEGITNKRWKSKAIYLAGISLCSITIYFITQSLGGHITLYASILSSIALSLIAVAAYAYRHRLRNVAMFVMIFFAALGFTYTIDYAFNNVMQVHQQKRVLDLLGLESDLRGWGYNVNQSKIAIGSGGFSGKGFLEGTQTKYNFVPEQSTDFIFCTVGEEWGFLGSAVVVILFSILIMRLIAMGERQQDAFGRIYCYCAASVFLFHFFINIGMTIGVMPVIGIPLPFFSYGGSSMIAFTVLLFVAIKLDSSQKENISRI